MTKLSSKALNLSALLCSFLCLSLSTSNIHAKQRNFSQSESFLETVLQTSEDDAGVIPFTYSQEYPPVTYANYLSGSGTDIPCAVLSNAYGEIFVIGETTSQDFPISENALQPLPLPGSLYKVTVTKFSREGNLLFSSYLTSSAQTRCGAATMDNVGRVYITGWTYASDFPVTETAIQNSVQGASDAFLTVLSPDAVVIEYSTLFGGSDYEWPMAVAVDSNYRVWIAGQTGSGTQVSNIPVGDLPLRNPLQSEIKGNSDGFIALIDINYNASQRLLFSSYLGGEGSDILRALKVDAQDRAWFTGTTASTNWPLVNSIQQQAGAQEVVVGGLQINNLDEVELFYSTVLGGSAGDFGADSLDIDNDGRLHITGITRSHDFPVSENAFYKDFQGGITDAFWTVLDTQQTGSDQIVFSTYLGGSAYDAGTQLMFRSDNKVFISGVTKSVDFNTWDQVTQRGSQAGGNDIFLIQMDLDYGFEIRHSLFLKASQDDAVTALGMDNYDEILMTGYTNSPDFPQEAPLVGVSGEYDGFLLRMDYKAF